MLVAALPLAYSGHAAVPYNTALHHEAVHAVEHATFLATAVLFWTVILGINRTGQPSPGLGILLLFATAMQSVFLCALLTFANTAWYTGYTQIGSGDDLVVARRVAASSCVDCGS